MVTSIDSNILTALFKGDEAGSTLAQAALLAASKAGDLILSPVVYAELLAAPKIDDRFLDAFCKKTRITVQWQLDKAIWLSAAAAYKHYADKRRKQKNDDEPRRILADFLIGAHALSQSARLLSFDDGFANAFPSVELLIPGLITQCENA